MEDFNFNRFIKKFKRKNLKALDYFVCKYSNFIFKVCNAVLNDRELSKECVNDVILKIWDNIESFIGTDENFLCWIASIAKYTAIDRLRKEAKYYKQIELLDNKSTAESILDNIIAKEKLQNVRKEINNMENIDKEIFLEKFFEDKASGIIAKKLGVTEQFINLRIFRGRKKLKNKLNIKGEIF